MTSPPDSELPAGRDVKHGPGVWIALAVAVLVLVVLLGVPGFIAAGLSKKWGSGYCIVSVNGDIDWATDYAGMQPNWVKVYAGKNPGGMAGAELMMLAPAGWLVRRSEKVRRFYNWEYSAAHGVEITIVD